ncbi:MAG: hypothetical protein HZA22_08600 [Nitrospirae bacterium]|nr:hypothetical protein [Nitrospirota bacterium]
MNTDIERWIVSRLSGKNQDASDQSHDLDHFMRVNNIARKLLSLFEHDNPAIQLEYEDRIVLSSACLLHDIGDKKLCGGIDMRERNIRDFLGMGVAELTITPDVVSRTCMIVSKASFSDFVAERDKKNRRGLWSENDNLVCDILEDSDRIDAIGAVGIARCLAFKKNVGILKPNERPRTLSELGRAATCDVEYRSAITHFFEKLLHIHKNLNLDVSKRFAQDRHELTVNYLKAFLEEYKMTSEEYIPTIMELQEMCSNTNWYER